MTTGKKNPKGRFLRNPVTATGKEGEEDTDIKKPKKNNSSTKKSKREHLILRPLPGGGKKEKKLQRNKRRTKTSLLSKNCLGGRNWKRRSSVGPT